MHPAQTVSSDPIRDALGPAFRGTVVARGDDGYDEARAVYNARIDRRPRAIVRCTGTSDVVAAVRYARETGIAIAVRGGGRHVAGYGTIDDGLVIDLGPMSQVTVDPIARIARIGGGARNRDGVSDPDLDPKAMLSEARVAGDEAAEGAETEVAPA